MADEQQLRDYLKVVTAKLRSTRTELDRLRHEPIAVVGMGCRYAGGVDSPEALWRLVADGADAVAGFPADRGWDTAGLYDSPDLPGSTTREGAFLYEAAEFDAAFFGISPREALAMDPQQRLLLETSWEAVERAGIDPATLHGSRTGVFTGVYSSAAAYGSDAGLDFAEATGHLLTGTANSVLSGRISFTLGLVGPAVTVDTACSSSLVALHLAVQALRAEECDLALAGGATLMSSPVLFREFSRQQGLAADGRCKPFSADADGTGWGEGAGMVVLERLSDARRNGHPVLAVISGSAVNQDGASNGLTAPNGSSQRVVIRAALDNAQLTAADVDAVEAHGTGTRLGDPIEAQALLETYGQAAGRADDRPLWLGSVKSNIGHTQAAAGVAGVIKMVMALRHGVLPRTLHSERPSEYVDWTAGRMRLLQRPVDWPRPADDTPRRAAVSAFGISGTNAHLVLEDAPEPQAPAAEPARAAAPAVLPGSSAWVLSGRTPQALAAQARKLSAHLATRPGARAAEVAWSLATTRTAFEHRAVLLDPESAGGLAALAAGEPAADVVTGQTRAEGTGRTVFVLPGQGSQWVGMGRELAGASPVFAARLAECAEALAPYVDWQLDDVLAGLHGFEAADVVQPALWAVMVSLAAVWEAAGVVPDAVVGHSQGEIAAAVVAGSLSLADAAKVVALRSRTLTALAGRGGMMAVDGAADTVRGWLEPFGERLSVAAVNGPSATVVAGDPDALHELAALHPDVRTRVLPVDYASHSAHVEELREDVTAALEGIEPRTARIPMVSAMDGRRLAGPELDPAYWYASLRETVEFARAVRTLGDDGYDTFVEVSPHPVLAMAVGEELADRDPVVVGTLRRDDGGAARLLASLGEAYAHGAPVDWTAVLPRAERADLPTYAFQRGRYWPRRVEAAPQAAVTAAEDGWRYRTAWEPLGPTAPALAGTWLVVAREDGDPARHVEALTAHGAEAVVLRTDAVLREALAAELTAALAALPGAPAKPAGVLSLLALDPRPLPGAPAAPPATAAVPHGTAATLALVQALGDAGIDAPLWALTRGAVRVAADDAPPAPVQAQVWGLGRVAALEHPDRWGGLVDLPEQWDERAAARLAAVLADGAEDQLALRRAGAFARRLVHAPRTAPGPAGPDGGWSPRGTVLVTGATGSIGPHLTAWLAGRGAARLVLPTRSGPGPRLAAHAAALAEAGTAVDVLACDLADRSALAALLDRVAATGPRLSTVLHAANAFHLTRLDDTDPEGLAASLAGKAAGADHLDELVTDADEFLLFSSIAAAWGSAEHGAYAAANAHLDALAERRAARGAGALSLGWGVWDTRDWTAPDAFGPHGPATITGDVLRRQGTRFLDPDRALDVLGRLLADGAGATGPYLALADMAWDDFAPVFTAARRSALLDRIPAARRALDGGAAATGAPTAAADGADTTGNDFARALAGAAGTPEQERLATDLVRSHAAAVLGHRDAGDIAGQRAFRDLGFDSLTAVELRKRLATATGLRLPSTIVFDHPTPASLGAHLAATALGTGAGTDAAAPARDGAAADPDEPLAIVGIGCRFPGGVTTPDQYWDLLASGADVIGGLPTDRGWDPDLYDPDPARQGKSVTHRGGFLHDAPDFDAAFFGINPREALAMDPQQRLLLETSWEALERAGIAPESLRGTPVGVFAGATLTGYGDGLADGDPAAEGYLVTGHSSSIISGRVAYALGLEGPALTIDTACSSGLVALHLAGRALRAGECELALVGGVMVMSTPSQLVGFSRQRGLAPDGRCKPFAAGADGMGLSEGAATIAVERLSDARRLGHPVLAVVRGTAINQDGASNGLTAPSGLSQQRVIRAALDASGLTPDQIDAVEAHGTGTPLGDPVEAHALLATYGRDRPADRPLWLGSAKSNIGHTQTAAGLAGLVKMVLGMRHGTLPRTLHADEPSREIDWESGAVRLLTEQRPWTTPQDAPRRAGVSAFGMSGTNVHVLIEQAPEHLPAPADPPQDDPAAPAGPPLLAAGTDVTAWPVSARGRDALAAQAGRLHAYALAADTPPPAAVARALATTRSPFEHRAVVVGADPAGLGRGLAALMTGQDTEHALTGESAAREDRRVFVFPGQGSQWEGMGRRLSAQSPVFAARFAECARALRPYVDWDPHAVLAGEPDAPAPDGAAVMQPLLWAVMVSLAAVWEAAGVVPDAVVGHSQGEIAAATVAGALTLEDAARIVAVRAAALTGLGVEGGMLSVVLPVELVRELLEPFGDRLAVAAVNAPATTVVSGEPDALVEFERVLRKRKAMRWRVPVTDFVAHSRLCEPLAETLPRLLADIRPRPAAVPLFSTVHGRLVDGEELGPRYWYANVRQTVRFAEAVEALAATGHRTFVEVSAHPVLLPAVQETLAARTDLPDPLVIDTLRRDDDGADRLLRSIGTAYVHGLPVDWTAVLPAPADVRDAARRVELPTYAFQHRRFWPPARPAAAAPAAHGPAADPTDDWRFLAEWAHAPEPAPALLTGTWLVLTPAGHPVHPCAAALAERGARTVTVELDTAEADRADYARRLTAALDGARPAGVLSLLALDTAPLAAHPAVARGLAATLALVQALGDAAVPAPLWLLTAGAVTTDPGTGAADPQQAPVWALGRTVAAEHPDRWGGLVDLPGQWDERAAARLAAVLAARDENEVALRADGLRPRRLAHAPRPPRPADRRPLAPRGTVLVTGGTGHIGGHAARWLARECGARRLVLTSRSGPAAAGTAALAAELAAAGAAVDVLACDTAERPALAAVLDRVAATGPALSTVLHAAGALDDGVLDRLDAARLARTFDGKAGGAAHLDELTAHLDLDAFVLCSSISATFGNGGQGNYAAANAYLDALAEQRRARGLPATSLAWGPWAGGGVGQASEGARRRLARNKWEVLMEPEDAVRALAAAVEDPDPRLAVLSLMAVDFAAMATARGPEQLRRAPLMRDLPEIRAADAADAADPAPRAAEPEHPLAVRLSALTSAEAQDRLLCDLVRDEAATVMGYASAADVEPGRAFSELGLDSLTSVELRNRLSTAAGLPLPATLLYDYPDPQVLAAHLRTRLVGDGADTAAPAAPRATGPDPLADPVAIVAMGCRLPGGIHTPEQLWQLLDAGQDAVTGLPTDRGWDLAALYDPTAERPGTFYAREGGFLHEAAEFDAAFFGVSPREAVTMDPQQRLLLEVVWETLERGGIDPTGLRGSRTGVFVGGFGSGYDHLTARAAGHADHRLEGQAMIGTATSVLSGRVSYLLGLEGPAFTVDTACSSSLVALHSAAQALRAGECDLALVGGVTVMPTPRDLVGFSQQRGLAADGRCKAFGEGADGMGMAEGVGVLAVERLSDAHRNGHQVLGVVRGSAVNQDGASNGLTAPSGPSQQRVIRAALAGAGLTAADVDAVEAHGTGTELGDPIEAQALLATYGQDRPADRPLWLGSVKSNIGHTQAAAGVAGIMKIVLALRHGQLPRTLHADTPTPHVDWTAGHVALLHRPVAWAPDGERPRRAGVSSFGVSGTNAHVIIEEAPARPAPVTPDAGPAPVLTGGPVAWPVGARDPRALAAQAGRLRESALARPDLPVGDVAWSLATTRPPHDHRAVLLGADHAELLPAAAAVATGQSSPDAVTGSVAPGGTGRTVFVFPGHGSQWIGMGRELAEVSPVFRDRLDECARALSPYVDWDLADVLAGEHDFLAADVLQPAVWAVSVALAAVWQAAGVSPDAVVGHSLGEIAAATVAGALTLEDGAKVAALRSRALRTLDGRGGLLSVAEPADTVRERLAGFEGRLALATVNGPRSCVVSGDPDALDEFAAACPPTCRTTRVPIAYASHSPQVEELREEILAALAGIEPRAADVPLVSAYTGQWQDGRELDAHYWYASLRGTVEFERAVRTLGDSGHRVFVEVSGHPALTGAVRDTLGEAAVVTGTLRRQDGGARRLLTSLATAYVAGAPVDWAAVHGPGTLVDLPTYAFQRSRYWPEPARPAAPAPDDALTGLRYRITWTRTAEHPAPPQLTGSWLLVGAAADPETARKVARALAEHGATDVRTLPDADRTALAAHPAPAGVVSLLALDESPDQGHPTMTRGVAATLDLIQQLGAGAPGTPLWVLTSGAVATGPGESGSPAQAQVWGLGRVAGLEHPGHWGGLVDLPPAGAWDDRTGTRLAALLSGAVAEDQTALRPQGILARRLVRAAAAAATPRPGRGTVLVTGGTGAIGAEVGRWLAGRGAERVVLAAGEPLTADVARLAADVAASGAALSIAACDTTRRAELGGLLGQITADGGPALRGVVHAVGAGQATAVADTTARELADVAGARSAGARWLDELTADLDLDDFVLFSSVAATWGSALVPGYATGSAFVDALAEQRRARGQVATSVAWGPWADGGAGARSSVRHGLGVLDPGTAVRALGQAMDGRDALVTIADVDWRTFAPAFTLHRPSPLLADLPEAAAPAAEPAGPADGGTAPEFARTVLALPAARRPAAVTDLVRAQAALVLSHGSTADIDAERAFRDLGFDSLTAIELRDRLAAATGVTLPSTVVFEYPTSAALAAHLLRELGAGPDSVRTQLDRLEASLSGLLDRLGEDGDGTDGDEEAVAAQLAALSAKWQRLQRRAGGPATGGGNGAGTAAGQDVSERLAAADDDEVFDLLGKEFGIE
ncbi:SDR family NAD(P)-dependent oxidoreductase [Kitasatospora sp. NPDC056800]|uniref:SDR family NAD(P)-dependent oxidoreductase n=1 Tax=Kitasatospora sp. NPDC056800 TaxID=3345948 RepID=UPI0036B2BD4D